MSTFPTTWTVYGTELKSRFLLGTAGYPSPQVLADSIAASGAQVVTVGLKRTLAAAGDNGFIAIIQAAARERGARLLPNTAGCRTAREAVTLAHMARELYGTPWIKLEVVGDEHTLQPDPWGTVEAAAQLVRDGFAVFPYCTDDLVTCQRLLDAGCEVLMPWGAPIGSGQGLINPFALRTLRAPARRAADRGRGHRRTVACRTSDGAGHGRRAAELGRVAGGGPGAHGARVRAGRRGRARRV
jgi:thiazole synthase